MGCQVTITAGSATVNARLFDTLTALKIAQVLPLAAKASTWGDEVYFTIPVEEPLDSSAQEIVREGDIGFWPPGQAFCLFFGKTPLSIGDEIRPASAVNIVGVLRGAGAALKKVQDGDPVVIEKK